LRFGHGRIHGAIFLLDLAGRAIGRRKAPAQYQSPIIAENKWHHVRRIRQDADFTSAGDFKGSGIVAPPAREAAA
jgi:hypothetical protein